MKSIIHFHFCGEAASGGIKHSMVWRDLGRDNFAWQRTIQGNEKQDFRIGTKLKDG